VPDPAQNTADLNGPARPSAEMVGKVAVVDADSEVRRMMKDTQGSALKKYMALTVGRPSLLALLKYELLLGLLCALPGALGLVLRQKLYRHMFAGCGRKVVFGRNVTIRHPHRIRFGDNIIIDDNAVLDGKGDAEVTIEVGSGSIVGRNSILSCKGGAIRLAQRVNISVNCTLISETLLSVGENVLIAGHCYLIAGGNHGLERTDIPILEQPLIEKGGIDIKEHCWLGANVTVLDGVTIGRDSAVAAGAVVTKSVAEYTIVGGVPAKVLRDRKAPRD
jgi:acetyltransferase-like isoleucine patch superfamily enzyme